MEDSHMQEGEILASDVDHDGDEIMHQPNDGQEDAAAAAAAAAAGNNEGEENNNGDDDDDDDDDDNGDEDDGEDAAVPEEEDIQMSGLGLNAYNWWQCEICTYLNRLRDGIFNCEICDHYQFREPSPAPVAAAAPTAPAQPPSQEASADESGAGERAEEPQQTQEQIDELHMKRLTENGAFQVIADPREIKVDECDHFPDVYEPGVRRNYYRLHLREHAPNELGTDVVNFIVHFIESGYNIGDKIEAQDKIHKWYVVEIQDIDQAGQLFVRWLGWDKKWDEWIDPVAQQDRLAPVLTHTDGKPFVRKSTSMVQTMPFRRTRHERVEPDPDKMNVLLSMGFNERDAFNSLCATGNELEAAIARIIG
eukprot:TRINITY_DN194_c1_g1_i3.p1 TRINITY_DN194_c1_g1~~TRINITY_DN194_c1_g1_i3.p1  ORF type:complete len:365 (+),score=110.05 TRINITY_DN194_c1_g1_i3:512-1606(+)